MAFDADAVSVLAANVVQNGMLAATHSRQAMTMATIRTASNGRRCREEFTRLF